jgi:hypothetical protein
MNQAEWTQFLKNQVGPDVVTAGVERQWWWNHTDSKNLRLSKTAIQFINKFTKIPVYECNLPEPLRNRTLVQLGRLMTCPYYINKMDHIMLLGEEETVLLKLHANNLQQYLDNLELNQS